MNLTSSIRNATAVCLMASAMLYIGGCLQAWAAITPADPGVSGVSIRSGSNSDSLHVVVGHTFFLNTAAPLKRIYVSNPVVLGSFTSSPNEVLITAKTAGVSSLVIWDALGKSNVYTVSVDVAVDGLNKALEAALPEQKIQASALEDRIELSGMVDSQADADAAIKLAQIYAKDIANSLTVKSVHVKQVELKVRFIEIDRVKLAQFGANFLSQGKNIASVSTQQFSSFGALATSTVTPAAITNPLNLLLYNQGLNLGVALADLEEKQVIQTLAEPTITAMSGEEANFLSGGEFPFPVVQGGSGSYASVTVQFRPYGVKLVFTPTVNPDGTIRLKVAPEVSALDYTNEVQISGYDIPALSTRRAQTDVELENGQSFAISGLLDRQLTDTFSRMPGIASIPVLGQLFRSKNTNTSLVELLVIVTPTIVNPLKTHVPVVEPKTVLPYLDKKQFDQQINNNPKKQ